MVVDPLFTIGCCSHPAGRQVFTRQAAKHLPHQSKPQKEEKIAHPENFTR
jgi:hypothetical protein